jgi:hypothetical protein
MKANCDCCWPTEFAVTFLTEEEMIDGVVAGRAGIERLVERALFEADPCRHCIDPPEQPLTRDALT